MTEETYDWLCTCGKWNEDWPFHCSCGEEPPCGCDCDECNQLDELYYLPEVYPDDIDRQEAYEKHVEEQ